MRDLISEIPMYNEKETANNVSVFLSKKLKSYLQIIEFTDPRALKSPQINDMPTASATGNKNETALTNYIVAKSKADAVNRALTHLNEAEKVVIDVITQDYSVTQATMRLNISESQFYRLRQSALCKFAVAFMQQVDGEDLRVFDDKENENEN